MALDGLISRIRYGNGVRLEWISSAYWTGGRVVKLLTSYGIRPYAFGSPWRNQDRRSLRVRKAQAGWAEYILLRAGVPLVDGPGDPGNRNVSARPADPYPVASGRPVTAGGLSGLLGSALFLPLVGGVDVPTKKRGRRARARRRD